MTGDSDGTLMQNGNGRRIVGTWGNGLPIMADRSPPSLTQQQYDAIKLVHEVKVRQLNMSNKDDVEFYTKLRTRTANRQAVLSFIDRQFSQVLQTWLILVEWSDAYGVLPQDVFEGHPGRPKMPPP